MGNIDELCINTLRFLAVDQVEKAKSGHPGAPLGAAPMVYALWDRFLHHSPGEPAWFNRDRFILSAGHASALLYSLLHLSGYDLPLEELKRFRQWGSKTPGHPEHGHTPGVEATTGPLGQGFAMGVGFAIAESMLTNCFNQPHFPVVNHHTYALVSDGDLMEGISSEAASLAGTLHLNKLIYLYDDNHISIEGDTQLAFAENVEERFVAYGWNVIGVSDGNNLNRIIESIQLAQTQKEKPSLIMVRTHIGYGSPKQDTASAHGEPLGREAVLKTKEMLGWPLKPPFYIPEVSLSHFRQAIQKGVKQVHEWNSLLNAYRRTFPNLASQFDYALRDELPVNWRRYIPSYRQDEGPVATRSVSGNVMNTLTSQLHSVPEIPYHFLVGGSADLSPSTKTMLFGYGDYGFSNSCTHNIHFGVREHAMGAIANGIALHGGFIPYAATFLIFSDYMRPAIRLAAMMQTHVIFIFTHDSIAMGQDGPTHQPIEHLMGLRAIPGLTVIRPADANETAIAWQVAIERSGPVALILTRQSLPILELQRYPVKEGVPRGGYTLAKAESDTADVILVATGSEVHLALAAQKKLTIAGIRANVVSMPSWELFEEQLPDYRREVLLKDIPKLAIEAGATLGWYKYVGDTGDVIGLNRFGASAPGSIVYEKLGFNVDNVIKHVNDLLRLSR